MAIDATNLALVRLEYGDTGTPPVFNDAAISGIWDMMSGASSDYERIRATVGQMFVYTLNKAQNLHDYSQGESDEKKNQIVKNLERSVARYQSSIDAAIGTKTQIARNSLRTRPHQTREYPVDDPRYDLRNDRVLRDSSE